MQTTGSRWEEKVLIEVDVVATHPKRERELLSSVRRQSCTNPFLWTVSTVLSVHRTKHTINNHDWLQWARLAYMLACPPQLSMIDPASSQSKALNAFNRRTCSSMHSRSWGLSISNPAALRLWYRTSVL